MNFVVTYIDDILIFGGDEEEDANRLKVLMQNLEVAGLKINRRKWLQYQPEITFLSYQERNHKELRRVLGMFGFYQRCVPAYSTVVHPLQVLLNAHTFLWKEEHSKAVEISNARS